MIRSGSSPHAYTVEERPGAYRVRVGIDGGAGLTDDVAGQWSEGRLRSETRAAVCQGAMKYFHVGAGIVADSNPAAEYDETLAKASGFLAALNLQPEKESAVV